MTFTLSIILLFLAAALLLYVLLGGADFGGGILELVLGQKRRHDLRQVIDTAMAPVWEANHVWLILAVVIVFMGFPPLYTIITVHLHLPLLAVLLGIVVRGSAFTFRHYDTLDQRFSAVYSRLFTYSSLWTSFFLGVTAGALVLGRIAPEANDFVTLYINPWCNLFCVAMGLFTCSLFTFLAAAYLVGETNEEELRLLFRQKAMAANAVVILLGVVVFTVAEFSGYPLISSFFRSPISIACIIGATILWFPFWYCMLHNKSILLTRLLGASIVGAVMAGWFAAQYPEAVRITAQTGAGRSIQFIDVAAPTETLRALMLALLFGSAVIFPALGYLFSIFKKAKTSLPDNLGVHD